MSLTVLTAIVLGPRSQSAENDSPWTDLWPRNADIFPVVASVLSGNTSAIEGFAGFAVIDVFSVQNNLDRDLLKIVSLRGRRSRGKGKEIRARDRARRRREEENLPFLSPSRAQIPPSPSPFNACHAGYDFPGAPCIIIKMCYKMKKLGSSLIVVYDWKPLQ